MKLKLPFYIHKVGAGFPSPATDYIEDDVDLNTHLIKNAPATFIIRVQGKSMSNVGIYDGDLLIVDRSIEPKHKNIVIAAINGSFACKRLILKPEICLMSENPKYKPIQINKDAELELAGTVIAAINIY